MDSKEPLQGVPLLGELNTNEIPAGIDREKLEQIDAQVTDRLVIGKLSYLKEPVVIHGVQFLPANFQGGPDWLTVTEAGSLYGENNMPIPKNLDKSGKFVYMLERHLYPNYLPGDNEGMRRSQAPLDLPILRSLSLLWGTDANNPDKSRVGLSMPVQNIERYRDGSQRNWGSGRVLCSLPQTTAQELIGLIRKNPVHAEFFLTNTFAGLDRIYMRTPVNQVLLWDVDNYIPQDVTNFRDPQELFNKAFRKRFNLNAITSASYGNAGFFPRQ